MNECEDWLVDALRLSRKALKALPADKQAALSDDARFREAVKAKEQEQ